MDNPVFHEIIQATRLLNLSVVDQQGPWAATLFFIHHDNRFYYFSSESSRHVAAIDYTPNAAVAIQPEPENWMAICGLQMSGSQQRVNGAARLKITSHYLARYPFVAANAMLTKRLEGSSLVCFTPTTIHLIDNRQGFAQRQQLL